MMKGFAFGLLGGGGFVATFFALVFEAGALGPPGPPTPTGYTLKDIYDYLRNPSVVPEEGAHSLLPSEGPGGAPVTIKDIMDLLKSPGFRFRCDGGGPCRVPIFATGQTKCYDRNGNEIPCNSAAYPGQDAVYHTGVAHSYTDNGDGTVTDNVTGLMWQKTPGPPMLWQEALQYCESLTLAGHTDWRLPNINELHSLVRYDRNSPAIDPVFDSPSGWWYWSSSSWVGDPRHAWDVYFGYGYVGGHGRDSRRRVRAVRGGL